MVLTGSSQSRTIRKRATSSILQAFQLLLFCPPAQHVSCPHLQLADITGMDSVCLSFLTLSHRESKLTYQIKSHIFNLVYSRTKQLRNYGNSSIHSSSVTSPTCFPKSLARTTEPAGTPCPRRQDLPVFDNQQDRQLPILSSLHLVVDRFISSRTERPKERLDSLSGRLVRTSI